MHPWAGGRIPVHLKIDTGNGETWLYHASNEGQAFRESGDGSAFLDQMRGAWDCKNLLCEGVYTHFAASDSSDKSSANRQLALFKKTPGPA